MANEKKITVGTMSQELKLMLHFLSERYPSTENVTNDRTDINWHKFLDLVIHHRVYPILYPRLNSSSNIQVPEEIMTKLGVYYNHNILNMLQLTAELKKVHDRFHQNGIKSIMLKGPLLSLQLYGDLSLRTSKDLDILIPQDKIEEAERLLHEMGYITESNDYRILSNWKKKMHHLSFYHPTRSFQIEIHWRLNPYVGESFSFNSLWERRASVTVSGNPYPVLGNEDLLIYLSDHGARHGWFRLRWLLDIERLMKTNVDLSLLKYNIKRNAAKHVTGQAIILVSELFKTDVSAEIKSAVVTREAYRLARLSLIYVKEIVQLNPVPEKRLAWKYKRYMFALLSGRHKLNYALQHFMPSPADIALIPLPKRLYLLYYPLRPFLWFWRKNVRKEVFIRRNEVKGR